MLEQKIKGRVIACHDCRAYGYIVYQPWGHILPPRWKEVKVRRKWLYICGDCQQRRRREVTELLKKEPRRKWWRR